MMPKIELIPDAHVAMRVGQDGQTGGKSPRWEYLVINTKASGVPLEGPTEWSHQKRLEAGLCKLGSRGWSLCCVVDDLMIFKRRRRGGQ
jgi:hypothetical protein